MRPVEQTQLSEQRRETEAVRPDTHTPGPHVRTAIWWLLSADAIVHHLRYLIRFTAVVLDGLQELQLCPLLLSR